MTMKELMDLGAPELPPGHFYRVRSNAFGHGFVEIRRRRRGLGSTLVVEQLVPIEAIGDDGPVPVSPEDGVAWAAVKAVEKAKEDLDRLDYWGRFRALEGDHRHDFRTAK